MSKEPDWPSYAEQLAHAVSGALPAEGFFYRNVVNCFGLGLGGQNRARLLSENWLPKVPGGPPAWLVNA